MTQLADVQGSRHRAELTVRRTGWGRSDVLVLIALAAVAIAARWWNSATAYDLFVDEIVYDRLGLSMQDNVIPVLNGGPFFLHPPGFFLLDAGWQALFGDSGDVWTLTFHARSLNAVLGGFTVVLGAVLVREIAGRSGGLVAAALLLVDPFVLRQNGRVLLETSTATWVVAGFALLLIVDSRRTGGRGGRFELPLAVISGLLLGFGILTKDTSAIFVVLPLLAAWWRRWILDRRLLGIVLGAALLPYLTYLGVVVANGYLPTFLDQKFAGVLRLVGVDKSTGFNRQGSPSLSGRLLDQLAEFWTTYALMGLGLVAAVLLLRRGDRLRRFLGTFVASALAYLGYALVFGTIEEHFAYYLVVPACLAVAVVGADLARAVGRTRRRNVLIGALAVVVLWNGGVWFTLRSSPDDGYQQVDAWLQVHGGGQPLGVTTDTGIWSMADHGAVLVTSLDQMRSENVRFFLYIAVMTDQGYSTLPVDEVRQIVDEGRVVYTVTGRTNSTMEIIELPAAEATP